MEQKYFIIHCGEDISKSIVFDITDKLKEQGHYFVVNCTNNIKGLQICVCEARSSANVLLAVSKPV